MKGIILAGGTGSRLYPITLSISKQIVPVYDKPLIYYPISTLMLAGIREFLVITTPEHSVQFQNLLGEGEKLGISIQYAIQKKPRGIAEALVIGEQFTKKEPFILILGDNIFHGPGVGRQLKDTIFQSGCTIFTSEVADPSQYGVVELNKDEKIVHIREKPKKSKSKLAITGMYVFDETASLKASKVSASKRGELEIVDVINQYLKEDCLKMIHLERSTTWFDCGTFKGLNDANNYVRSFQERKGQGIAYLEEIVVRNSWVTKSEILAQILDFNGEYYNNLRGYLELI